MITIRRLTIILVGTMLAAGTLSLSGCGSSGSDDGGNKSTPSDKTQRRALEVEDITSNYTEQLFINPWVDNIMGTPTYRLIDSIPEHIAYIDPQNGKISVSSPGTLTIEVTDTSTVYEDSITTFTVTIDKGINYALSAQPQYISVDSIGVVNAENNKGAVSYRLADDSLSLLAINAESGELEPHHVGHATVIIEDAGNDKYAPASINIPVFIKALTPGIVECTNFTDIVYSQGLTLSPQCLSGDDGTKYNYKIYSDGNIDQDVIDIDSQNGLMTVKKVGHTVVEVTVTYDDRYNENSKTVYFRVDISQGHRQTISVENQIFTYLDRKIIQPNVSNVVGHPRYEIEDGNNVIKINEISGYPQIIGVGTANIRVIDSSNSNYPSSLNDFHYTVTKAPHPGLKSDNKIKRSYADDLVITPEIEGQKGKLVITSNSSAVVISGQLVEVKKAGKIKLTVKDLGDDFYLESDPESLVLDIAPGDHPAMKVAGLTTDYAAGCFSISLYVQGNKGHLVTMANSDESIAKYNEKLKCINLFKAGSTTLSLYSDASANYKQSKPVDVPVIVNKVGSTLKAAGNVTSNYDTTLPTIQTPTISGSHGKLTFALAPESATDVVKMNDDVSTSGGSMTVLNAGTTTISVTDSGTEQYVGSMAYFNVTVGQAENRLSVAYPLTVFESGRSITPVFSNSAEEMKMTFELISGHDKVELVNRSTGELKIKNGGDYSLKVKASSRNYKSIELTVHGKVEKAPHPGLATPIVNIEYTPLKKYRLELNTPAIGTRVFAIDPGLRDDFAKIDSNTGELTLLNYDMPNMIRVHITETGNGNYEALKKVLQKIIVTAPSKDASHQNLTIGKVGTLFSSRLNQETFKALKETKVSFAGIVPVKANDNQLQKFGIGSNLMIKMKPVDETATIENMKQVLVYVQRFDGCSSTYDIDSVSNGTAKPVAMVDNVACSNAGGVTQRYLKFIVVDDHHLQPGDWEAVTPFVIYRHSSRKFKPTSYGGCYVSTNNSSCTGGIEPESNIHEWNLVDVKLTKE
ncbi:hypothetical protein [Moritella sp. Urea-trap-13]|uniref:hypothetical protein n=1 Tax=Moritella sp. Urea-trap-13 TaxID=2058327 RepID=UPI000C3415D8|nr:hypothetical protein [Moritella sp. Urea-trap-13]PKH07468.1 hypothetical protein CXF93_07300 [Moritella sp. Urea-trap-13]